MRNAVFGVPSALFEAGYISNAEDQALLASPQGQEAFARAAAQAIRVYFARRSGLAAAAASDASPSP